MRIQLDIEESACGSSGVCSLTQKASNNFGNLYELVHEYADVAVRHRAEARTTTCGIDCVPPLCSGDCTFPPEGAQPPAPNICDAIPTAPGCVVTPIATGTTLQSSNNPAGCSSTTLTATVTPGAATGNVEFSFGTNPPFATVALSGGTASTVVAAPQNGTYTAKYLG